MNPIHQYYTALSNLAVAKEQGNRYLKEKHNLFFKIMDSVFILMILSNIGALVITNALVFKADPVANLYEANPTHAELAGLEKVPEERVKTLGFDSHNKLFLVILFRMVVFGGLLWVYIVRRNSVASYKELYAFAAFFVFLLSVLGMDFFNDFGFWLGKIMWGVN